MNLFAGLFVVGSWVAALVGLTSLSEATMGVGFIAAGCFLGIQARLLQAQAHQDAQRAAEKKRAHVAA
jgi:hypothetical protein